MGTMPPPPLTKRGRLARYSTTWLMPLHSVQDSFVLTKGSHIVISSFTRRQCHRQGCYSPIMSRWIPIQFDETSFQALKLCSTFLDKLCHSCSLQHWVLMKKKSDFRKILLFHPLEALKHIVFIWVTFNELKAQCGPFAWLSWCEMEFKKKRRNVCFYLQSLLK